MPADVKDAEVVRQLIEQFIPESHAFSKREALAALERLQFRAHSGWIGLANLYELIEGKACEQGVALGMASSAVERLLRRAEKAEADLTEAQQAGFWGRAAARLQVKLNNALAEIARLKAISLTATRDLAEEIARLREALEKLADHNVHGWTLQTEIAKAVLLKPGEADNGHT